MDYTSLPMGFSAALAQNPEAMKRFFDLPESQRATILQQVQEVSSRGEMDALVRGLSSR